MSSNLKQLAVRWYPPSFDVRVEEIEVPGIIDPDDAIVKVTLAALCGSDLHIYRGDAGVDKVHTCGHEFIGQIVSLGSNFGSNADPDRPILYSTLKVGDKVVSPFTVNCGECHVCRLGFTCRCPQGALFGSPVLEGGQAQYVRVPKAGATLFNLSDPDTFSSTLPRDEKVLALSKIKESSFLLLADILPTGVFAALQALNHPKVVSVLEGRPWPLSCFPSNSPLGVDKTLIPMRDSDKMVTFAIVGLGPVGVCTAVSLLDMLATRGHAYKIVTIDPLQPRREKMKAVYNKIPKGSGEFIVENAEEAKKTVEKWTAGIGCTAVLEIVGNSSALTLAYELVRPFGMIVSVGVHGAHQLPLTGQQMYNKNVSFDFGRCPAKAMFPMALDLLIRRQDVFGSVGEPDSLVDRVVDFTQVKEMYDAFDKGKVGKIVFDPWK